jgi:orotate phosphoribosyltransferase-like protein
MNRINVSLQQSIIALVERGWSKRRIARQLQLDRATVTRQLLAKARRAEGTSGQRGLAVFC